MGGVRAFKKQVQGGADRAVDINAQGIQTTLGPFQTRHFYPFAGKVEGVCPIV